MQHQFTKRQLSALIIPLVLESAFSLLIGIADTMMVGSFGEAAISAVALSDSFSALVVLVFASFATGGSVVIGQYLGKKDKGKASLAARNLLYLTLFLTLLLMAVMVPFHRQILHVIYGDLEASVTAYTSEYLVPVILSYLFLGLYSSLNAITRAEGKTSMILYVSLVMNGLNILGNFLLVVVLHLGPKGAGISTLVSRAVAFLLMASWLFGHSALDLKRIGKEKPDKESMKTISRLAIPQGIEGGLFNLAKLMVASLAASLGTRAVAIDSVAWNFNAFSTIIGEGLALSLVTIAAQCRGAGNEEDIHYYRTLLLKIFLLMTILVCPPLFFWTKEVIALYGLTPEAIEEAVPLCRAVLLSGLLLWPFGVLLPSVLKAAGDMKYILVSNVISMWVFRVLLATLLVKVCGFGLWGLWIGTFASLIYRGIAYELRYRKGKWKSLRVI
ncbi:MAG: MATE family efflux transporter [Spirochaetales bacterium]|nr:MATE family efflux transporter [Candidatus Physcosoma equi]